MLRIVVGVGDADGSGAIVVCRPNFVDTVASSYCNSRRRFFNARTPTSHATTFAAAGGTRARSACSSAQRDCLVPHMLTESSLDTVGAFLRR